MPNLVGIWEPHSTEAVLEDRLSKQLTAIASSARPYVEHSVRAKGFVAATLDHGILEPGRRPTNSADKRYHLLIDGELWNAEELARRHRDSLSLDHPISQADLALRLIIAYGPEIARDFNGFFVIVLYDAQKQSLTLINDRHAFRPIFYRAKQDNVIFATELKGIRATDDVALKLNEIGLFELMLHGHHLYGSTWIEGYERLVPSSILTFTPDGTTHKIYWDYLYQECAPELDQPTYFVNFAKLLDRAVERCMRGSARFGMFLSGGYDSRSVAAAIRSQHLPIPTFTFGVADARDVQIAPILAQRLGMQHTHLVNQPDYLSTHCHGIVWRTEGMLPFSRTTSMQFHPQLQQSMDIVLTGFLGEFSGSHTWPALLLTRSRRAAIDAIWKRYVDGKLDTLHRITTPAYYARSLEAARQRFEASCELIDNDHPLNIADVWNRRFVQPQLTQQSPAVDRHVFEVRAPHMDADLVIFLQSIPPRARLEQRIYKKMIAYSYPQVRDIPCTNSGRPIDPNFVREYLSMTGNYLGRKSTDLLRKISGAGKQPLRREIRDLGGDYRAEPQLVEKILRPMLAQGLFPSDIFSLEGIENIIEAHYSGRERHQEMLASLISFGLAHKYFALGEVGEVPEYLRHA